MSFRFVILNLRLQLVIEGKEAGRRSVILPKRRRRRSTGRALCGFWVEYYHTAGSDCSKWLHSISFGLRMRPVFLRRRFSFSREVLRNWCEEHEWGVRYSIIMSSKRMLQLSSSRFNDIIRNTESNPSLKVSWSLLYAVSLTHVANSCFFPIPNALPHPFPWNASFSSWPFVFSSRTDSVVTAFVGSWTCRLFISIISAIVRHSWFST